MRPTTSLVELADKLEGTTARLAEHAAAAGGPEPQEAAEQGLQEIRDVCSSLRGVALLFDSMLSENTAEHREAFRALVCAFAEKMRTASHASQGMAEQVGKRIEELDDLSGAEPGEAFAARLQGVLARVSQAAGEVGSHIAAVAADVDEASQEMAGLENVLVEAGKKAHHDDLTGTSSRLALDLAVYEAVGTERVRKPWSFLLVDLDHLRGVNEKLGRVVGDALLRKVARMIERALPGDKAQCMLGRYGGDEFGTLVHGATIHQARELGEHVRESISSSKWTVRGSPEGRLEATVSIGVTEYRAGDTVKTVVERCEAALRRAKANGRNRVAIEYPVATGAAATQRAAMRARL